MNTMNNYEYNEGIEFNGLMPKVMEADGIETIGASNFNAKLFENGHLGCDTLEVVDFFGTAFGENGGGEDDKQEYVDLGLPSGTLWAPENIKDAEGNELYFAWGETQGYTAEQVGTVKNFYWVDYKYGTYNESDESGNYGMTKYNMTDGLTVLEPEDDAATVNLGEGWRMPTKAEFEELIENTDYEWTTFKGIQGAKFTSKVDADKFLFFPDAGRADEGKVYYNTTVNDNISGYWSASLSDNYVDSASILVDVNMSFNSRYIGYPVRPVRSQNI